MQYSFLVGLSKQQALYSSYFSQVDFKSNLIQIFSPKSLDPKTIQRIEIGILLYREENSTFGSHFKLYQNMDYHSRLSRISDFVLWSDKTWETCLANSPVTRSMYSTYRPFLLSNSSKAFRAWRIDANHSSKSTAIQIWPINSQFFIHYCKSWSYS